MPSSKRKAQQVASDSGKPTDKKRSLAESRAAAKEYADSLKRAKTSPSPAREKPSSRKKPRLQDRKSPSPGKVGSDKNLEARKLSRKRAQEYAQTLLEASNDGTGEGMSGAASGASDGEDDSGSNSDSDTASPKLGMAKRSEPPPAPESRPMHSSSPRRRSGSPPKWQPSPSRCDASMSGRRYLPAPAQPLPPLASLTSPQGTQGAGGLVTGRAHQSSGNSSFLRHAGGDTSMGATETPMQQSRRSSPRPSLPQGEPDELAAGPPEQRTQRQSFLSRVLGDRSMGEAQTTASVAQSQKKSVKQKRVEVERGTAGGVTSGAGPFPGGGSKRRAAAWTHTCAVILAPLILSGLVWGVLVPAWPHARLAVATLPSRFGGFGTKVLRRQKCFLARGEDASICKEGMEAADCPSPATCSLGRILSCDFPFNKAVNGEDCVLSAAVTEEADAVVKALRQLTIEQQCGFSGLIVPSASRSFMTLTDAAAREGHGPLSLLAVMPAGNVAGLIHLEGERAEEFGGGNYDAEGGVGSGSERIARLSEATLRTVRLPWGCRARLWAGRKVLAHWQLIMVAYVLILAIVCLDVRRQKRYRLHVRVCAMRDESYKALLNHAAKESSPMQTSHIQAFVGDRQRAKGKGSTASIQKNVRKLWPYVEREVEYDTRIRRSYKNIRGQHNVPCWEWLGPKSAIFENIGGLDPGPPPRLWLLHNLYQRAANS